MKQKLVYILIFTAMLIVALFSSLREHNFKPKVPQIKETFKDKPALTTEPIKEASTSSLDSVDVADNPELISDVKALKKDLHLDYQDDSKVKDSKTSEKPKKSEKEKEEFDDQEEERESSEEDEEHENED